MVQTQDLEPVLAETSGFYIFRKEDYLKTNTRINQPAYPVEISEIEGIDIDTEEDYKSALRVAQYWNKQEIPDLSSASFIQKMARINLESDDQTYSHIAFDLDGVLIDSLDLMKESWAVAKKGLEEVVPQTFEAYAQQIGKPFYTILKDIGVPERYHQEIREKYEKHAKSNANKIRVYDGVIELLNQCQDRSIKCSIVTSKSRTRTLDILQTYFNKIKFSSIITPECVEQGRGKPFADQLLKSCLESGSSPSDTLYVGDMDVDYHCAKNASVSFAHALWGYGSLQKFQPYLSFLSPNDLSDYFFRGVQIN